MVFAVKNLMEVYGAKQCAEVNVLKYKNLVYKTYTKTPAMKSL